MRLVHISDLHLGFRQFQRQTPTGINQREADVARTFRHAIDRVIALDPELVVIAGDVFHSVRPTNQAIVHAFLQLQHMRQSLPHTPVVMIAGNHDTPRSAETGCILRLFAELGIEVVDGEPRRLSFTDLDLSLLAVPDMLGHKSIALEPEAGARWNVLLLHGEVEGMLPEAIADTDRAAFEISREDLRAAEWNYIALGHYHVHREIAPTAWYSGSIDYTSHDIWGELREERQAGLKPKEDLVSSGANGLTEQRLLGGKGIVEHDLATGTHTFHRLPVSRRIIDLPQIQAVGMSAAEVDVAIGEAVERIPGGVDDAIVRLVVRDIPRHVVRELDHKAIRELRRRALHFHLDTRRPQTLRIAVSGAPGRRPSLQDIVREKLRTRPLSSDLNREALVELGLHYLSRAEAMALQAGQDASQAPGMGLDLDDASLATASAASRVAEAARGSENGEREFGGTDTVSAWEDRGTGGGRVTDGDRGTDAEIGESRSGSGGETRLADGPEGGASGGDSGTEAES
jgi:exonuclease SbcD